MKKIALLLSFLLPLIGVAQVDTAAVIKETEAFQQDLNKEYKNKSTSPLLPGDRKKFKQHDFFPVNAHYAASAHLTLTPEAPFKPMAATGPIVNEYRSFAIAQFELNGTKCELTLYQSKNLMNNPEYQDYLFLPFTDETTGNESYGGGRYLEVRIPKEGDTVVLNFNKAYNPYCAYNHKYSCPLVPATNSLPVSVEAGVKFKGK
jgi:uncharacterized protein (DUF1684 family)